MKTLHLILALALCSAAGCASTPREVTQLRAVKVECRLDTAPATPGAAARRTKRMSAYDCADGGGSYVPADALADLNLWLPLAKEGNAVAQTHVGTLYEQGMAGISPDPSTAAGWYRKAVKQEHAPAMLRLAALTEQGLGVRADPDRAQDLLRRASRGKTAAVEAPRFYLVDPPLLLSSVPAGAKAFSVVIDRPEGPLALTGRVTAVADRPNTVQVNEQTVKVDGEGYFRASVKLRREGTRVVLKSDDAQGKAARIELMLTPGRAAAETAPALPVGPKPEGELHALLIANQDYRWFEKLDTPANDARDLRRVLERRFGFKTTLLLNATRREVLGALATLRARLDAKDELLVFYAGHGEVDPLTQRAYWIPVDARRDDMAQWVSTVDVSDQLQATLARHVMLIVDSCYAGSLNRRSLAAGDAEIAAEARRGERDATAADTRTRVALSSGGLEPVSDGAGGRNSLYAATLLDVLGAMSAPLAARQLHGEVSARFVLRARELSLEQRPHYGPVRLAGHEAGDFTLVPRKP